MKKIVITGYYGFSNYGDDLFVRSLESGAREYWPKYDIRFISPPIDKNKGDNYLVYGRVSRYLYSSGSVLSSLLRILLLIRGLIISDVFVYGGGSIISSRSSIRRLALVCAAKRLLSFKLIALGVSIGPFDDKKTQRSATKGIRYFDLMKVRDKASLDFCNEYRYRNVTLSSDLVGILAKKYKFYNLKKRHKIMGLNVMDLSNTFGESANGLLIDVFLESALRWRRDDMVVCIQIFVLSSGSKGAELNMATRLHEELLGNGICCDIVDYLSNPIDIWRMISRCSGFIGVRLHSALTAYLSDVPFTLVEYHEKCTNFLDDIGFPEDRRVRGLDNLRGLKYFDIPLSKPTLQYSDYISKSVLNYLSDDWDIYEEDVY